MNNGKLTQEYFKRKLTNEMGNDILTSFIFLFAKKYKRR